MPAEKKTKNPKSQSINNRKDRDLEKSVHFKVESIHVGTWKVSYSIPFFKGDNWCLRATNYSDLYTV